MTFSSTVLIGSIALPELDFLVGATASTIPAGTWFLRHGSSSVSLLSRIESQMTTAGVGSANCRVRRDRLVRLQGSGTFTITWIDTLLRDLLGFTGDLSGASLYVASSPSRLLFSAGRPATRTMPDGVSGYRVPDERHEISRDGSQSSTTFNHTQIWDTLQWSGIPLNRIRGTDASTQVSRGGTWAEFWGSVLLPNAQFQMFDPVTEYASGEAGSTSPMDISSTNLLGTYRRRELPKDMLTRRIANANSRWNIEFDVIRQ